MNESFVPILLCLREKPALLVGGGQVALRKAEWLLQRGLKLDAISPEFLPEFQNLAEASGNRLILCKNTYEAGDVSQYALIIAATNNKAINQQVAADARRTNIPVNVVDVPELCDFYIPATVSRGKLEIAISTSGASPALSGRIRRELEKLYPDFYTAYTSALGQTRNWLREKLKEQAKIRQKVMSRLAAPEYISCLQNKDENEIIKKFKKITQQLIQELEE